MTQIQKYTWLIETVRQFGPMTQKEISDRWANNRNLSEGKPLARQTFLRWINAISLQLGIEIRCDVHDGYTYSIVNYDEAMGEDSLSHWMIDTYAVCDVLSDNRDIRNRISVPQKPSGYGCLVKMLSAIKHNQEIRITYQRFGCEPYDVVVRPLCVRLYDNRWYLIGLRPADGLHRTYSLDRIMALKPTGVIFEEGKNFDAEEYFSNSFGIVMEDGVRPCIIRIRAYGSHVNYMRTLPMHQSQKVLTSGMDEYGEYTDFEYYVAPTYDLVMHLAGLGCMVRVLKPQTLADTMREWMLNAAKMYGLQLSLQEKV